MGFNSGFKGLNTNSAYLLLLSLSPLLTLHYTLFLSAFTRLRKATITFFTSVCPSVCPHGTTHLPMERFSWNLIFQYFSKNLSRNFKFLYNRTRITG